MNEFHNLQNPHLPFHTLGRKEVVMNFSSAADLRLEIIKRISPGYRHKLSGKLQPIALLTQLLAKKIEVGNVENEFLLTRLVEIKDALKLANNSTDQLFTWLYPDHTYTQPLSEMVNESLDLLKMEIYASNVTFDNKILSSQQVNISGIRDVVIASILTYIDTVKNASTVTLSEFNESGQIKIKMELVEVPDKQNKPINNGAKFVNWADIIFLTEDIDFFQSDNQVIISKIT